MGEVHPLYRSPPRLDLPRDPTRTISAPPQLQAGDTTWRLPSIGSQRQISCFSEPSAGIAERSRPDADERLVVGSHRPNLAISIWPSALFETCFCGLRHRMRPKTSPEHRRQVGAPPLHIRTQKYFSYVSQPVGQSFEAEYCWALIRLGSEAAIRHGMRLRIGSDGGS